MAVGVPARAIGIEQAGRRVRALEFPPAVVASVMLAFSMALLGAWVSNRAEEGVLQRQASETVLAMDSFIKPLVQDLAQGPVLPDAALDALSAMVRKKALGADVAALKIWLPNGTIAYSNRPEQIGRTYPLFANLRRAFNGQVVAQFDDLTDDENEYERSLGLKLLEIYAPVRESGTNQIIAVAEFYEIHENLRSLLWGMRLQAYAVVGLLALAMIACVSWVMSKQRRQSLEKQITELSQLLAYNNELRGKIQHAHHRMAEINELFLRRVSAELHDAPAQLIGFALLRLDALRPLACQRPLNNCNDLETIRNALGEALNEIRNISAGLAAPELADLSLVQALEMAATRHAGRTGTAVNCDIAHIPYPIDPSLKVCLYRFAQEGLNNAFRHADGHGQALRARCDDGLLEVMVSDEGPVSGIRQPSESGGLGLAGLRGRIESLGGVFEFQPRPHRGTRLTVSFNLANVEPAHA
jgi:signal transduction histidine kinase